MSNDNKASNDATKKVLETELTNDNFNDFVEKGYTFVDFWAEWCTPCRMVAPVVEKLAQDWKGKIKVGKLNTDDHPEIAMKYQVMGIPTFIMFKDGELVDRMTGAVPPPMFTQFVTKNYKEEKAK